MEQLIILLVYVLIGAAIIWGIIYACKALSVPLIGQWCAAAVIVVALLYALVKLVDGGGIRLPVGH